MTSEGGYDPCCVIDWLDEHATRRDDGRYLTLNGRVLEDTHRDTFARWLAAAEADAGYLIPLGRLDEILLLYGVQLWELDDWITTRYGTDGYSEAC